MEKGSYNYARDGFIYLLSYATLLISSLAANFLLKGLVNKFIPDALDYAKSFPSSNELTGFFAAIVVAFPVFWYLNWYANKMLKAGKIRHNTGVRRWLLYITLVVVILIIIGQFINLFMAYLSGKLVVRLLLHILITLLISFLVLGYQWWHLKLDNHRCEHATVGFKVFEYFVLFVALASIVGALFVLDSPSVQRDKRLDEIRVEKLITIYNGIQNFYGAKDRGNLRLPETLSELANDPLVFIKSGGLEDPLTKEMFSYKVLNFDEYELCATFATDNRDEDVDVLRVKEPIDPIFEGDKGFVHPAGNHCFSFSVRT
ncbi:MAG: DUF5671 domain-containing protein [Patescibacteria group bacterium]|nr:DUF5671 domain-containing protein [Patescibacteria group bacterium]